MTHSYPTIQLLNNKDKRVKNGYLWVFSNEIIHPETRPDPGTIVRIYNAFKKFIGIGFYHPNSLIAIRILTREDITIDDAFFRNRLEQAVSFRKKFIRNTDAMRLVHAESDGLPGLIVDQYADGIVLQVLSAGMEKQRNIVISSLAEILKPNFIILRNDHNLREREGLDQSVTFELGEKNDIPVTINENSLQYSIDPLTGQKTGFYIDQREHRLLFQNFITSGDLVCDAFCHDGGFAMHAAKAGASKVLAIDNSEIVLEKAQQNFINNGLQDIITCRKADLLKHLPIMAEKGEKFNVINLDPPNFANNRKSVGPALRGYRKLHRAALTMLPPGGILVTSSCSHHITEEAFLDTVTKASGDCGKRVQILYKGSNPVDHPVLPEMPETGYLKFLIFRVVDIK